MPGMHPSEEDWDSVCHTARSRGEENQTECHEHHNLERLMRRQKNQV